MFSSLWGGGVGWEGGGVCYPASEIEAYRKSTSLREKNRQYFKLGSL